MAKCKNPGKTLSWYDVYSATEYNPMHLNESSSTPENQYDRLYENISRFFSTQEGQNQLLESWKGELGTASSPQLSLLWAFSIEAENEDWLSLLWESQRHQQDPVLHSTTVIMSSELNMVMADDKKRKTTAFRAFAKKFKEGRPELLGEFEENVAAMSLRRSMVSRHIEDQCLLEMFSSRPDFAWMKFGGRDDRRNLSQEIASILEPIVQRVEISKEEEIKSLSFLTAPSVLSTIKHCCQAGMMVSGTSGLALGKVIGKGVQASPALFRPALDCWLTHGGAWQTLLIVQPELETIIMDHPKVKTKILRGMIQDLNGRPRLQAPGMRG